MRLGHETNIKKILVIIFLGIFLISLTSALTFKQSEQADIKIVCINAGYCTASAVCNASVFDPDNIVILDGVEATQSPSLAFYNITLNSTQTSKLGQYSVAGFCKDGSVTQLIDFNFDVTITGHIVDTGETFRYIMILVFLFVLFCIGLYFSIIIPYGNIEEMTRGGLAVTKVTKTKYFKILIAWLTSGIFMWFINVITGMINNYITESTVRTITTNLYLYLNLIWYGFSVAIIWVLFYNLWKDIILNKTILKEGKALLKSF
jgi:hypothetical protein